MFPYLLKGNIMTELNSAISTDKVAEAPKKVAPFDAKFVLRITLRNIQPALKRVHTAVESMRGSIDKSIDITLARMPEFENDIEKSNEAFKALSDLHALRKQLDSLVLIK